MKLVTPRQMNEIDSMCINRMGIPGAVLMENAALRVVEEIEKSIGPVRGKRIFLFAGKGNNGGDAFATARHLYNKGAEVNCFVTANKPAVSGDAGLNMRILENMGIVVEELVTDDRLNDVQCVLDRADLVVDGIFGTGLRGEIEGLIRALIEMINDSRKPVISIDIPSGISGSSGKVLGTCIKAKKTVTFGLPKTGLVVHPGCRYTGELVVADIGIPARVVDSMDIDADLIDAGMASGIIPLRYDDSNKGSYGRVFIVSGSTGMTGSGCMAAGAALRSGAGLVYLGVPASLVPVYSACLTEPVIVPLEDYGSGYLSADSSGTAASWLGKVTAAAVGPGLSLNADTVQLVRKIIEISQIPLVLDADALNAVSSDVCMLEKLRADAVITPHPGEMSRLAGISIEDVQNNRIDAAREFALRWKVVTVLKGSRTVVADRDGHVYINPTGNPGMATAGAGDVLTGIIAGLIAQGVKPVDAAVAGVYLHGLAGDNAAVNMGEHGLTAGDLIGELPFTIKKLAGRSKL